MKTKLVKDVFLKIVERSQNVDGYCYYSNHKQTEFFIYCFQVKTLTWLQKRY